MSASHPTTPTLAGKPGKPNPGGLLNLFWGDVMEAFEP